MMRPSQHAMLKRIALSAVFVCGILIVTRIALQLGTVANASTVAFCFLLVVLLAAFVGDIVVAITTSVVATLCFNYFFLPPIGTWRIAAFDDWIALIVFLITAIAISRLTASAHENATKARNLEKSELRLREFGLWLISVPADQLTFTNIAEQAARFFSFTYCSIHLLKGETWQHFSAKRNELSKNVEDSLKSNVGRPFAVELMDDKLGVRYTQIRKEMEPVLVLAVKSEDLPVTGLNTLACMIGLLVPDILREPHRMPAAE